MTWNNGLSTALAVGLMAWTAVSSAQTQREPNVSIPQLRDQLLQRMEIDQRARRAVMDSVARSIDGQPTPQLLQDMRDTNTANRIWLSNYLADNPWPSISEVAEDGAHAAWIIVQHADDNRQFQRNCLTLMRNMYDADHREVNVIDLAYLTDRVRVASGKAQLYGTQVMIRNGRFNPVDVEKPEELDVRRERLGLQSMDDYLFALRQNYVRSSGNITNR